VATVQNVLPASTSPRLEALWLRDGDGTTGQALAHVIVRFPVKIQAEAFGRKAPKLCPAVPWNSWTEAARPGCLMLRRIRSAAEMAADAA